MNMRNVKRVIYEIQKTNEVHPLLMQVTGKLFEGNAQFIDEESNKPSNDERHRPSVE